MRHLFFTAIGERFAQHPVPPHQSTRSEQDGGRESKNGPKRLRKPTESAEMKLIDPIEKLAGHKGGEDSWKAKADPRDSPYQNKKGTPKADCAVQVPIETWEVCFPVDDNAAPPILDSRPPNNGSG